MITCLIVEQKKYTFTNNIYLCKHASMHTIAITTCHSFINYFSFCPKVLMTLLVRCLHLKKYPLQMKGWTAGWIHTSNPIYNWSCLSTFSLNFVNDALTDKPTRCGWQIPDPQSLRGNESRDPLKFPPPRCDWSAHRSLKHVLDPDTCSTLPSPRSTAQGHTSSPSTCILITSFTKVNSLRAQW